MNKNNLQQTAILIAYDGSPFFGWQKQAKEITIQSEIERVLEMIFSERTVVFGASRTDTGVHSLGQVAHFSRPGDFTKDKLLTSFNSLLPPTIRILQIADISPDFHSQYSAVSKTYFYIINTDEILSPFSFNYCMQTKSMGDISKIKEALSILIGEHNFSRYTTTDGVKTSPVRTVYKTGLLQKSNLLLISITASGYLRYMVRSIIGTLLKISQNKISIDQFKESLEGKIIKPLPASLKADARGLYLYKIYYKENPFDNLSIAEKDFNLLPFFKEIDLCQL